MDIKLAETSKDPSKDTPKILKEEIPSKGKIPETCGKLTGADIRSTSAHCDDSSKDAVEPGALVWDEDDNDVESTEDKKVEKYFSDIESSDDSLGYAPNKVSENLTKASNKSALKSLAIKFKPKPQILDLETVESEEDFFEDCVPVEDTRIESTFNSPITTSSNDEPDGDTNGKQVDQVAVEGEVRVPEDEKSLDKMEKEIDEDAEAISTSQVTVGAEQDLWEAVLLRSDEEAVTEEAELHITLPDEEANLNVNETRAERNEEGSSELVHGENVERENEIIKKKGPEYEKEKVDKVGDVFESKISQADETDENTITECLTETEKISAILEESNKAADDQGGVETLAVQQEEDKSTSKEKQTMGIENEDSNDKAQDENRNEEANVIEEAATEEPHILMNITKDTAEEDEQAKTVSELSEELENKIISEKSKETSDMSETKSGDSSQEHVELKPTESSNQIITEKEQGTDDKKEEEDHENLDKRLSSEIEKDGKKKEDSDLLEKTTSSEAQSDSHKDDKVEVSAQIESMKENEEKEKIKSVDIENKKGFEKINHMENNLEAALTEEGIVKDDSSDVIMVDDCAQKAEEVLISEDFPTPSNQLPSIDSPDNESHKVILQDGEEKIETAVKDSDVIHDSQQNAKEDTPNKNLETQSKQSKNVLSADDDDPKVTAKDDARCKDTTIEKQSDDATIAAVQFEKPEDLKEPSRPLGKPETARSIDKPDSCVKEDTTMKSADNGSGQSSLFEDEEPLLMIDTAHKEDNENEYNEMDTETEQTQTTDSSSEGSLEIFYDKECVNYECKHESKNFFRSTLFALNFYKITKKRSRTQFVCEDCYDRALDSYEEMCKTLKQKQPLLSGSSLKAQEFVEIIDSSDDEDVDGTTEKTKDENTLPKESIEMLEAELEGAIRKVMHNVEIQNQLSWTKQILQQRLTNLEEDTEFVSKQLRLLQKQADNMHNSLYQCPKIKIRQLTPLDLNSGRSYNPETESTIPPIGEVLRASIYVNETYYAVKNKAIASWVPCKVMEVVDNYLPHSKSIKHYKIKFLKSKYPMLKTVSAKHMAFFNPPKVRLPIGTRVIAYFDASTLSRGKEKMLIPSAFYPGIIAEPLKQSNKFRYLVFYDDGYFQYVYHKDVRLVCHASENVWEDVHHQSREFIHNYLTQYAVNRPMVQTQKGQSMLVDYNGKWVYARVIDVDCSLVQMLFEGQSRSEWIYRGSTRLGPVFKESNNSAQNTPWSLSRASRRTEPFIRYINGDDSSTSQPQESQQQQQTTAAKPGEVRSVAKKSVSRTETSQFTQQPPVVRHLNNSTIFVDDDNKPKGKVVYYTARKNLPPRNYVPHLCSPSCLFNVTHNLSFYSPLAKPLLSGWERQVFRQKSKKFIVYRGPCGKRMRSMEELHRYLRVTEDELNVDNFDFSPETNCLAEYVIESCIVQKKDISNGKEKMPIPCVNYYDNTMPPDCVYSSRRIPTEGVPLNLDREFLVGCDCEDDCSDKSKCSCWELTYAGAKYGMPNVPNEMVGYQFKRLYEHVPTGIYECNSRCKCKSNCVNRVVQQSLQSKLQVFKTSNRGWGLRCINDVPRGSFICVYAGHLLTEAKANEGGLDAGDEYFAELDYIEVAEQIKEGYESDVVEPDEDEELYNPDKDEDDDEFVAPESHRNRSFNTRLRTRRTTKGSTDVEHDSQERQVISFEPNKTIGQPDTSNSEKPTIRKLFGKDEACYIMDAKVTGNLGRYFNHSCSPNLFVQNVFVDTHDLRFPWVAFFAFTHIRAGTELTWNYNYEVGVVPGKVLYCQCGAPNCRQRLL